MARQTPAKPDPETPVGDALEAAAEAAEVKPADGVVVLVTYQEDGKYVVDVQTLGQTRITEVETILGVGRKTIRERLGIE